MLGNKVAILLDEFDLSDAFFSAETEHNTEEKNSTTFGALGNTFEPGLTTNKITLRGYFSGAQVNSTFYRLRNRMGQSWMNPCLAIIINTDDANPIAACSPDAWGQGLKLTMAAKDLMTFELNTPNGVDGATGLVVFNGVVSATGTTTPVNMGVVGGGSNGGLVLAFVQEITGTATNAAFSVQSAASSGGTYTDEATITFSGVEGYSAPMTGAIAQFVKLNVTNMGGATSFKVVVVVCVKGVTY